MHTLCHGTLMFFLLEGAVYYTNSRIWASAQVTRTVRASLLENVEQKDVILAKAIVRQPAPSQSDS